jgi:hemerythrin
MLAEWNESFSVGIAKIDAQHQTLFGLINKLHDGILQNRRRETLAVVLAGVMEYTAGHFQTEEDLLRAYGYPEAERHAAEHKSLLDKLTVFKERFDSGQEDLTLELLMELIDWLHTHLGDSDSRYKSFLHEKGVI